MLKKQSFKSMTVKCQSQEIMVGDTRQGCRAPTFSITALIFLRSCRRRHLPVCFFITNTGEFQVLVEGTICPFWSCSWTSSMNVSNLISVRAIDSPRQGDQFSRLTLRCCTPQWHLLKNQAEFWIPIEKVHLAPKKPCIQTKQMTLQKLCGPLAPPPESGGSSDTYDCFPQSL